MDTPSESPWLFTIVGGAAAYLFGAFLINLSKLIWKRIGFLRSAAVWLNPSVSVWVAFWSLFVWIAPAREGGGRKPWVTVIIVFAAVHVVVWFYYILTVREIEAYGEGAKSAIKLLKDIESEHADAQNVDGR